MAAHLGVSRAAVWKQIEALRASGYEIEASTRKGYRMSAKPDLLDADLILSGLETKWLGKNLLCFCEVDSTNAVAASMAQKADNGTVILAERQTQGKGRMARSWASPQGGIWMSIILKPDMPLADAYRLNMIASIALARAFFGLYSLSAGIKWPNDLLIGDQKICGILMEINAEVDRLNYVIMGIGINANIDVSGFPEEWRSTSLWHEMKRKIMRVELIQRILQEMEELYERMGSKEIYEEWRGRSITLGRQVRITSINGDLYGEAMDLEEDGALIVKTENDLMRVLAGDCIHLRATGST